jgi:tetratricopeptide (TPR) repeat protein
MIGLLLASSALYAEERRPTRGERLALEGRCEVAVPELEKELEQVPAPESAHVAWRLGQCALRARDYARAAAELERALATNPSLAEANLDLARARYHSGDLDGADAALRAGESLSGEALWQLYRGMVDLGRGDPASAVVALQKAVDINKATFQTRADPQAVEPAASYYLGVALRAAGHEDDARQRLDEVADAWRGTDWASEANRALGRTGGRRAWLNLGAGIAYNDNVVLSGRDTPLPEEISNEGDFLGALVARGGLDLGQWGANSAGLLASYRGRIHFDRDDLRQFDSHFPTASLWLNHALRADTAVRFRYDFGYAWVDTDPYLISNGGRLSLIHAWSARSSSELYARSFVDDYRFSSQDVPDGLGAPGSLCPPLPAPYTVCGPRLLNEHEARDLDGYGSGGGVSHAVTLPLGLAPIADPSLTTGYAYTYFEADGREYARQDHRAFLGLGFALPWSLGLDMEGSYTYRDFRHPTTFPDREDLLRASPSTSQPTSRQYFLSDRDRYDQRVGFDARLSIPLAEPFSLSLLYSYLDNLSTANVFDYDQHVVGFLLNVNFARAL